MRRDPTNTAVVSLRDEVLVVAGGVQLESVRALRVRGQELLAQAKVQIIDFSQADCVDSSALVLILAWLRYAKSIKKSIRLRGIPEQLFAVAEVYGIKELILA